MPLSADISTALHLLEHVQERVEDCDDPKLQMHTTQDLKSLISLLEDPVFRSIVTIQDSLLELNSQLGQHPSILPGDFDINISGQLELSVPNTPVQPLGPNMYQDLYQDSSELDDQRVPVAPLVHSSSEDTSAQVTSPSLVSEVMGMPPITTPTYAKEFKKVIEAAARGRQIYTIQLYKPEGTSLGFSVVGLRSKDKGELGIFLQEIQPNGIAGCDGRLLEGDQILAIDGQPLDSNISHEQAISILQKARGLVELVVARSTQDVGSCSLPTDELSGGSSSTAGAGAAAPEKEQSLSVSSAIAPAPATKSPTPTGTPTPTSTPLPAGGFVVERSPSAVSDASKSGSDMVLNTEWAQVEVINLINDGSGLGFGIIGGRSTGVVVKTILPGGVADRDNRLQSGDHILQIGDVNLRGMGSEQVAAVLRQSGTHVRLVVARPVEPTSPDYQALGSHAPIVPTKILGDPDELDRYLVHSVPETYNIRHVQGDTNYDNGYMYSQESDIDMHARPSLIMDVVRNPVPIGTMPVIPAVQMPELPVLTMDTIDVNSLPEMERFTVELKKDIYGLGITIAGYVCEKEELSGIFVKSISEGSAADLSNKIQINDRIVEVDGHSLQGYSNHEAVEVLRSTGQTVVLCLERYLRGPKYEQLQQAIAASELRLPQPSSPSITSLPSFPMSADGETTTEIEAEGESHTTVDSTILQEGERESATDDLDDAANVEALLSDPSSELTPQIRAAIKAKWQKIVGPDTEIVVAQLKKFAEGSGLGISLEGTVDVENGQEVRPHHYIRSILPEGPVGQNGTLRSGDELLEVNGYRLLGINHMEVVSVLKELPIHVRMVCGRNVASQDPLCPIDTAQHQAAFQTRSILGGSLQNLLPTMDRLVKAKSDGSLASTTTTATMTDASLNKMKSRSLEPLTGLAMWSSEPQIIELVKGERGLGFSILDYQDPMNPNETVIVIRSLVPGGVAQVDGQLIPGDRLLFVNDIALENATLDQAVQALKGAPKGTVRIGVAKPLPIPDSIVQQRITPICTVKRSKSFPSERATANRQGELEEFLSSRSGASDLSTKKEKIASREQARKKKEQTEEDEEEEEEEEEEDDEEEEDHWGDASSLTPVCSPSRKAKLFLEDEKEGGATAAAPATEAEAEEEKVTGKESSMRTELDAIRRVRPSDEEVLRDDGKRSVEQAAPKVKLKDRKEEEGEGVGEEEEEDRFERREKRKRHKLKRHASLDSSKSLETLEKSARKKRSREERKSLKEQECIERVTQYLSKHSILNFSEAYPALDEDGSLYRTLSEETKKRRTEEREKEKAREAKEQEEKANKNSDLTADSVETSSSAINLAEEVSRKKSPFSQKDREKGALPTPTTTTTIERPSSLRKKKVATFSRESSRESMLEDSKKEVRIREVVQEIFFEDASEHLSDLLPQVQLVKAKIITAEEVAATRPKEESKVDVRSPPEQVFTIRPSVVQCDGVADRLQIMPTLAKSTSENALIETPTTEENQVSQRNIKPEILLDLSKVSQIAGDISAEEAVEAGQEEEKKKRKRKDSESKERKSLNRTASEGSKRSRSKAKRDGILASVEIEQPTLHRAERREEESTSRSAQFAAGKALELTKREEEEEEANEEERRKDEKEFYVPREKSLELSAKAHFHYEAKSDGKAREEDASLADPSGSEAIRKEHSLEYQSQTLESQSRRFFQSVVLWNREVSEENAEAARRLSFKETQYSPKERREAETQTEQETKSTQCSPEQSARSSSVEVLVEEFSFRYHRSPKREVETQTQGESKSVQCSLDDLYYRTAESEGRTEPQFCGESSHFQQCKSVQCVPQEIASFGRRSSATSEEVCEELLPNDEELRGHRLLREVEVQTYQESKAVQCDDEDFGESKEFGAAVEPSCIFVVGKFDSAAATSSSSSAAAAAVVASPRKLSSVVFVEEDKYRKMTVTHRDHDGNVAWAKHWGPERLVQIYREPKTSLGLSIVGGKVDLHNGGGSKSQNISGIFIKNVLPNSPAGRTGELKIGDRIIEVDGVDLRNSTHERAVQVIQAAGNPVRLLVQSLVHLEQDGSEQEEETNRARNRNHEAATPTGTFFPKSSPGRSNTPEVIQAGIEEGEKSLSRSDFRRQSTRNTDGAGPSARRSSMKKSIRKKAPSPPSNAAILREVSEEREENAPRKTEKPAKKYSSDESSEEEDTRELEGNVYTKAGMEISRRSAGNVKRSKAEIEADPEEEDEFGYTTKKVEKKYRNLKHPVILVKVEKDPRGGVGLALAGHKDRNRMAVFICGINPKGAAYKTGQFQVGDEVLEVNGTVFQGRCHLNASAMIKGMAGTSFKIVVLRKKTGLEEIAVKPVLQFPPTMDESTMFSAYKGVRNIPIKKGQYGLGIMIIEGKHAEVGQGIFVSDIQEGSAAEQAGLQVGDLILAVNMDYLLGSTYDQATSILKKAEGVVNLAVCNPNQSKIGKDGEVKPDEQVQVIKEPEKPKEPEPPQDPKDCKIQVGRDTTIEFQKEKDKGIGFTITGGSDTPLKAVFILEVFPDGAAGKDGRLQAGDEILDMCQESFKSIEYEKAHATVLKVSGTITMVVHRSGKPPEEIEVELQKKSGKGAGLCLTGFKSGKGAYVSDLLAGGSALESGKICKGDQVVAICGQDVREAPVEDIAVHIKVSNPVQLKLARYKSAKQ